MGWAIDKKAYLAFNIVKFGIPKFILSSERRKMLSKFNFNSQIMCCCCKALNEPYGILYC